MGNPRSSDYRISRLSNCVPGYTGFVTTFALMLSGFFLLFRLLDPNFVSKEGGLDFSIALLGFGIFFLMIWSVCFVLALVPFILAMALVIKFRRYSVAVFLVGGAMLGVILDPIAASIPNWGSGVREDVQNHQLNQFIIVLTVLAVSGAAGGLVCRAILRVRKTLEDN